MSTILCLPDVRYPEVKISGIRYPKRAFRSILKYSMLRECSREEATQEYRKQKNALVLRAKTDPYIYDPMVDVISETEALNRKMEKLLRSSDISKQSVARRHDVRKRNIGGWHPGCKTSDSKQATSSKPHRLWRRQALQRCSGKRNLGVLLDGRAEPETPHSITRPAKLGRRSSKWCVKQGSNSISNTSECKKSQSIVTATEPTTRSPKSGTTVSNFFQRNNSGISNGINNTESPPHSSIERCVLQFSSCTSETLSADLSPANSNNSGSDKKDENSTTSETTNLKNEANPTSEMTNFSTDKKVDLYRSAAVEFISKALDDVRQNRIQLDLGSFIKQDLDEVLELYLRPFAETSSLTTTTDVGTAEINSSEPLETNNSLSETSNLEVKKAAVVRSGIPESDSKLNLDVGEIESLETTQADTQKDSQISSLVCQNNNQIYSPAKKAKSESISLVKRVNSVRFSLEEERFENLAVDHIKKEERDNCEVEQYDTHDRVERYDIFTPKVENQLETPVPDRVEIPMEVGESDGKGEIRVIKAHSFKSLSTRNPSLFYKHKSNMRKLQELERRISRLN